MKLSVIIVNYNVKYFLEVCLYSVFRAIDGIDAEVIVVDNNSTDGSTQMIPDLFPAVTLIANTTNRGFSAANNQAVAIAKGEYVLFLNPDTVIGEDFFHAALGYMHAHPGAGALGPRIIDGKGQYAPDSKKSFPTLRVALFKTLGIGRIFRSSAYFNKYYAVHIHEHDCAEVEVLSGCCMLVRMAVISKLGYAFDEDYFMYCEDVDLCYRIYRAGYKCIYFPGTTIIHYKGESTRRMTLAYVRTFNNALTTFVRKHYDPNRARLFIMFINAGIALRMVAGAFRRVLKALHMPLLDAAMLLATLVVLLFFWVNHVRNMPPIPLSSIYATFPVYVALWLFSLYFNGAYDQPYRALRVVRGMLAGTIAILAYYGLLPPPLHYSRAIIVFGAFSGSIVLLGAHELLHRLGILKYTHYDALRGKAVIVAAGSDYAATAAMLRQMHYAPVLQGRISTGAEDGNDALVAIGAMKKMIYTAGINEVIFCVNGLPFTEILQQMQHCGPAYDYKMHIAGRHSFVGSNSSNTAGDLYTADRKYNLYSFAQMRNKRLVDICLSLMLLVCLPVLLWFVRQRAGLVRNCLLVLAGTISWVGYAGDKSMHLPRIRPGVLPPFNIVPGYQLPAHIAAQLNEQYARDYTPGIDLALVAANVRYLGITRK